MERQLRTQWEETNLARNKERHSRDQQCRAPGDEELGIFAAWKQRLRVIAIEACGIK